MIIKIAAVVGLLFFAYCGAQIVAKWAYRNTIEKTLWFTGGDPVAIHTLVSAAHEIIHTLFKRRGLSGLFFDARSMVNSAQTGLDEWINPLRAYFGE